MRASGVRWNTKQVIQSLLFEPKDIRLDKLHLDGLAGRMLLAASVFYLTLVIQLSSVLGEPFEAHPLT